MLFLKFETLLNVAFSNFAILTCRQVLYPNSSFKSQLPFYSRKASTSPSPYLDDLCNKAHHSCRFYGSIIRSDQISRSVKSNSLQPHESQHARPPCPSPTPGVHWDSRSSSQRCHPAISFSVAPFSSYPQSLPASESFPMSQLFAWGGHSTGASALASFFPKKPQG